MSSEKKSVKKATVERRVQSRRRKVKMNQPCKVVSWCLDDAQRKGDCVRRKREVGMWEES